MVAAGALGCFFALPARCEWAVARSAHFEVYAETGPDRAKEVLTEFEELRSFFDRNRVVQARAGLEKKPVVRVIEFRSKKDYDAVQLRATADAYYTGTGDRDYIVMPRLGTDEFRVAAHEYAHFVLHSRGLKLPAWLDEGLAEVFSSVSITGRRCEFGGPLSAHVATLRRHAWLPAAELFAAGADSPVRETRSGAAVFYAESWALTDMLTSSPKYAPHFGDLMGLLNSGAISSQQALAAVYGTSPDAILAEVREWIDDNRSSRRTLLPLAPEAFEVEVKEISEFEVRAILADLLLANGAWERAERIDKDLLQQAPGDPEVLASLGTVALGKGDRRDAVEYWGKALEHGLKNASLCYRYALLAEDMGLPPEDIGRALEQAVAIQPDFDDARFKLALLKNNAGDYGAAVEQLQAMARPLPAARAFGYWTALAYALSELGKRDDAEGAAKQAMRFARSSDERARAAELAYVAKTDLSVRFARGADGKLRLATTRIPHGATEFNPFVEAGDQIQVETGTLREVQCSGGRLTGFAVESKTRMLTLSVPDPTHVLMRNSPSEFNCGPQAGRKVKVEYATGAKSHTGLLRGMEFQ